jgi:hypothetical protein
MFLQSNSVTAESNHVAGSIRMWGVPAVPPYHAVTADWKTRVAQNGGTVSDTTVSAVDALVKTLDAAGVLATMKRFNMFAGDQLAAAMVPLVNTLGYGVESQVGGAPEYTSSTGLYGAGSKYLNTGLALNAVSAGANMHMSATALTAASGMLVYQSATMYAVNDNNYGWGWGGWDNNRRRPLSTGPEHMVVTRGASGAGTFFSNGAPIGVNASPATLAPNGTLVTVMQSASRMGGYSIGTGLTASQSTAYASAVRTFNAAIGRTPLPAALHATTVDWATRVSNNGGGLSGTAVAAVDALVKSLDSAGVLSKIRRMNVFAGDQLAAALVPVVNTFGFTVDTGVNLVQGDYTLATGVRGNGSNKYIDTGLNFNSITNNGTNMHFSLTALSTIGVYDRPIGTHRGNVWARHYILDGNGGWGWGSYNARATPGNGPEHVVATRGASGNAMLYSGGRLDSSFAPDGSQPSDFNVTILGTRYSGEGTAPPAGVGNFSSTPVGGYSIGTDLSSADVTAYRNAMTAFNVALSRSPV